MWGMPDFSDPNQGDQLGYYNPGQFMGPPASGQFDFPVQDFRQQSFAQGMNGFAPLFGGGNTPAISRYQEYLGSTPERQDYQPNIWGKILASISGLSAGVKSPAAGIQTALGVMDIPYQRALDQYKIEEPGLRQAASLEEKQLGDKRQFLRDQQAAQIAAQQRAWEEQKFGLQFGLDQGKFGLEQKKYELETRKAAVDEAYKQGQLTLEQYQSETGRINAEANAAQSAASAALSRARVQWGPQGNQPTFGENKFAFDQALYSDPILKENFDDKGKFHPETLGEFQMQRYEQLLRQFGLSPSLNIGLGQ